MSSNTLYRVGGIAAILSMVFGFGAYALPISLALGALAMGVFVFALYRLFSLTASSLNLIAAILGIGGAVILAILVVISGIPNNALSNIATWAAFFAPALLFGYLALQSTKIGVPRILALIGIAGGVFGLLNLIVTLIGGGDWSQPNNPALAPLIMGTYYIGMLLVLVWIVWSGVVLLRRKTA